MMVSLHRSKRKSLTDIVFDNGTLKDDPKAAKEVMDDLLLVMRGGARDEKASAFIEIHDTVWDRVKNVGLTHR